MRFSCCRHTQNPKTRCFLTWFLSFFGQWCTQQPNMYDSGDMKDFLNNGMTWLQCFVPTLYAISVLRHLDLKTHFDNHCILSESMCVLLEKNALQDELDCLVRPFCKYHNCTDRDKLTSAYFVSGVGEDTNHKSSVLCNQFIIRCKYEKKISLCTFSLIHICHSLLELRVCL